MRIRTELALGLLIICAGCGSQAIYNQEVALAKGDIQPITFGPFTQEETVSVSVSAAGGPVSVYVFEKDKLEHVDYAITRGNAPENVLAGEASTQSATLTALAPANQEIVVRLQPAGDQSAVVQLKITKQ